MGSEIRFKGYEQEQGELFPGHVRDALDPADPVFIVDDFAEAVAEVAFERELTSESRPPDLYAAVCDYMFDPRYPEPG
jgi:hypothetical protein